jgi:hypothetical protein
VFVGVVGSHQNDKVLRAIIRAVEVAMMDVFMTFKGAAHHLRSNLAMFRNIAAFISHRVVGQEQKDVTILLNSATLPPTALGTTLALVRGLAGFVSNTITSAGAEHSTDNRTWLTFNCCPAS